MNPSISLHQKWIYRQHPTGVVDPEHYELVSSPLVLDLSDGEILVEARYLSVDPYMRINQSLKPTYNAEPHPLNTVQRIENSTALGHVWHGFLAF
jgi:NADPH-dependent curcumin reductase CurA